MAQFTNDRRIRLLESNWPPDGLLFCEIVEADAYVVRTGCSWRMLPHEFPHWDNVYKTFRRWSLQGKFEQINDRLRAQWRDREDRDPEMHQTEKDNQYFFGTKAHIGADAGRGWFIMLMALRPMRPMSRRSPSCCTAKKTQFMQTLDTIACIQ